MRHCARSWRVEALCPAASAAPDESLYEELSRANNELVNLQRELARANADLKSAVETLDAFARTVAHDLRTPLIHVQGFAQALAEDYASALDAQGQQYLQWVTEAAAKMETMVDGILQYSRLSHSEIPIKLVDLSEVAHEACNQVLGGGKRKGRRGRSARRHAQGAGASSQSGTGGGQPGRGMRSSMSSQANSREYASGLSRGRAIGAALCSGLRTMESASRRAIKSVSFGSLAGWIRQAPMRARAWGWPPCGMMTEKMGGARGRPSRKRGVGSRFWIELASAEGVNP